MEENGVINENSINGEDLVIVEDNVLIEAVENNEDAPQNVDQNVRRNKKRTSQVWKEFTVVTLKDGRKKIDCNWSHAKLAFQLSGSTSHLQRHMKTCGIRLASLVGKSQQKVLALPTLQPEGKHGNLNIFKFEKEKVRDILAKMVIVHEYPFRMVEHEFFILLLKTLNPRFDAMSRVTLRSDCMNIYALEKKKVKALLSTVNRISLTSDLWTSNQTISYICLTAHFLDSEWCLQKRVINFCSLAPPHTGLMISDSIFSCITNWGIEEKISTITLDNASSNDSAVKHLKNSFTLRGGLYFGGKISHVRCCAHILNLMVQDGLSIIQPIINNIRETVKYLKMSPSRLHRFGEIVKTFQLPTSKRLVLNVSTRWNSTYLMLDTALQFKEVFQMYKERDPFYNYLPKEEDWEKAEKIVKFLEVFHEATNVFFGYEYPIANLFLPEIWKVKQVLNETYVCEYLYMKDVALKMKEKFDKYWGECNLLMAIASILDPRYKMQLVIFCFPKMYGNDFEAKRNLTIVQNALHELYNDYVASHNATTFGGMHDNESGSTSDFNLVGGSKGKSKSRSEFDTWAQTQETLCPSQKSDLEIYLEEGRLVCNDDEKFDVLTWWKVNVLKFKILSRMAKDILSIPITIVASESTFSAGGRVLDQYRSSLKPQTVEALICTGDWLRAEYKVQSTMTTNADEESMQDVIFD